VSPCTVSEPSASVVAVGLTAAGPAVLASGTASDTALDSRSGCGVRTRTVWPELRAMNSSMVQSASKLPRPITMR
jgi:hypothetical protein